MKITRTNAREDPPNAWLGVGEKYAMLGLNLKGDPSGFTYEELNDDLTVLTQSAFKMPSHWREWLGSMRAEEVEECDLFVVAKMKSKQVAVLDGENQALQAKVWAFYRGLLLACRFSPAHKPVILTGAREDTEIGVRQIQDLEAPANCIFRGYPEVPQAALRQAADLATKLTRLATVARGDSHWRLFRILHLYVSTRPEHDLLDRLHQYARCIDGLVLTRPGRGASDFRARSALFIGQDHEDLMGEIYDNRSTIEHLHEDRLLEPFDRSKRLDLLRREAIVEHIVRNVLMQILSKDSLWPHFANRDSLERFWALEVDKRQDIWGSCINPLDAVAEFDPTYIHDEHLRT